MITTSFKGSKLSHKVSKKMTIFLLFFLALFFFLNIQLLGKMWEEPYSFLINFDEWEEVLKKGIEIEISDEEVEKLIEENNGDSKELKPFRFAIARTEKKYSFKKDANKYKLDNGAKLRFLAIKEKGDSTRSINLGITRFSLPEGAKLWIYSADRKYVEGPYLDSDGTRGELWTPIIPSNKIIIEVFVPDWIECEPIVEISHVNFEPSELKKKRWSCNIDAKCLGKDWSDQIRSVGMITLDGIWSFSGVLLNNTSGDLTPYFLTSSHRHFHYGNAQRVVVYWNYESKICNSCPSPSVDSFLKNNQCGAFLRALWEDEKSETDFALLELKEKPHHTFGVFYSGWDAWGEYLTGEEVVGLHHPARTWKAISSGVLQAISEDNSLGRIKWTAGAIQNGSSGAGIWKKDNKRCIGQLQRHVCRCKGRNRCESRQEESLFGKLSISWEGGLTINTRLKDWLDPCGKIDPCNLERSYCEGADPEAKILFNQISIGHREAIWGVGKDKKVYKWDGSRWIHSFVCCSGMKQVSVGFDGEVWGISVQNNAYRLRGQYWERLPYEMSYLSVSRKGKIWGVDLNNKLCRWTQNGWSRVNVPHTIKKVELGINYKVWVVGNDNKVYEWKNDQCQLSEPLQDGATRKDLLAIDLALDVWNRVWVLGTNRNLVNFKGYWDNESTITYPWDGPGSVEIENISVGYEGILMGVGVDGKVYIWRNDGSRWEEFICI